MPEEIKAYRCVNCNKLVSAEEEHIQVESLKAYLKSPRPEGKMVTVVGIELTDKCFCDWDCMANHLGNR